MNSLDSRWTVCCAIAGIIAGTGASLSAGDAATNTVDAKIAYYRARTGGPGSYPAYGRLGLAYFQKARETGQREYHAAGLECVRKSLAYQRTFDALFGMALGLSENHHFHEALRYAEEALTAVPNSSQALTVLFDIQLAIGSVEDAQKTLHRMFEASPGFEAHTRKAALCEYRGDIDGALGSMQTALELTKDESRRSIRAWAEVRVGSLQMARGEASCARKAYERALSLFPEYYLAKEHLAEWHAAHQQWTEAGALYSELLQSRPEPQYHLGLAEVFRRQNKKQQAERSEEQALTDLRTAVRDEALDQLAALALLLLEREDGDGASEALRLAERDWQIRKDAVTADTLAWAYWRNGRCEEALRLTSEALRSGTRNPAVLLHAGIIQCQSGQTVEGRKLLERALASPFAFGRQERLLAEQPALNYPEHVEKMVW